MPSISQKEKEGRIGLNRSEKPYLRPNLALGPSSTGNAKCHFCSYYTNTKLILTGLIFFFVISNNYLTTFFPIKFDFFKICRYSFVFSWSIWHSWLKSNLDTARILVIFKYKFWRNSNEAQTTRNLNNIYEAETSNEDCTFLICLVPQRKFWSGKWASWTMRAWREWWVASYCWSESINLTLLYQ